MTKEEEKFISKCADEFRKFTDRINMMDRDQAETYVKRLSASEVSALAIGAEYEQNLTK